MIRMSGITKSFGEMRVLDGLNLNVSQGEFIGLLGPNGSGKSTLLRILSGVEHPDKGSIELQGKSVFDYPRKELAKWLAVLEQDALPAIGFTAREVIEMGRYPFQNWLGEDQGTGPELIDSIIDRLNLQEIADRQVDVLSGGQRQRVALGRVMAQEPLLLLLDEPTTFLDITYQVQMMDYIRQWQVDCGLTVIAVLHDLNLAAHYCTRLLMLKDGMLVADGTPDEIVTSERIDQVYGTKPIVLPHPVNGVPQILLQPANSRSQ